MYKIAIIDDETDTLNSIYNLVKTNFNTFGLTPVITCYSNPKQLDIVTYYDILYLAIDMQSLNGIDLAQSYIEKHPNTLIVFITNKYDQVFNAFSVHPFDFIKKENLERSLYLSIKHIINKLNKINHTVTLHNKNSIINIKCNDIIYCESYGHKCYIHTLKDIIETNNYKLSSIEKIINSPDFYMINQSYLIHWRYVARIENKNVIFEDNTNLQISKRRLKDSLASFQKYILRNF